MDRLVKADEPNSPVSSELGGVTSHGRELLGVPRKGLRMLHRFLFCVAKSAGGMLLRSDEWRLEELPWLGALGVGNLSNELIRLGGIGGLSVRVMIKRRAGAGVQGAEDGKAFPSISASARR
jgi:hypothetical protein